MILDIGGKFNFSKYKKLADGFNIPCIIIGDNGDQNEGENRKIFSSFSYITKDRIEGGNPNVFVIKEGNLEDLMKAIDIDLYTRIENEVKQEYGRNAPKPEIAYRFIKEEMTNNPPALNVVKDLQERVLSFVKNFHNEVNTQNIDSDSP